MRNHINLSIYVEYSGDGINIMGFFMEVKMKEN